MKLRNWSVARSGQNSKRNWSTEKGILSTNFIGHIIDIFDVRTGLVHLKHLLPHNKHPAALSR